MQEKVDEPARRTVVAEALRALDPAVWPFQAVIVGVIVLVYGPWLFDRFGLYVPSWVNVPMLGALAWRTEGRRYRDIATWTVPLALAIYLAFTFTPREVGMPLFVLILALGAAFVFSNRLKERWLAWVAPGHYSALPQRDRDVAFELDQLDRRVGKAWDRLVGTQDPTEFRRQVTAAAEKARGMTMSDPEWDHVRSLWLRYLAWIDERDDRALASDEAWDDLHARREAYVKATEALAARRSYRIGLPRPA